MKTTAAILAIALTLGIGWHSNAYAESVYSVNIVGFQNKELPEPGEFGLIAAPFDRGEGTLEDILGGLLIGNASVANADRLRFWDADTQTYLNVGVGPDGKFYRQNQAGQWITPLDEVAIDLTRPAGFWIASSSVAPTNRVITLAGDVVLDDEIEYDFFQGFHIVANPFSAPLALQDMNFFESGASASASVGSADRVRVWDRTTQAYVNYGLGPDGQWYRQDSSGNWITPLQAADRSLEPGEALFYFANAGFTWVIPNPYLSMLND